MPELTSLRPPRLEAAIVLEDGRQLGYAEYGPSRGRALIWLHGSPGARRQIAPSARDIAYQRDLRIIGRLLDGPETQLKLGDRVNLAFEDLGPGISVPAFTLEKAA